ncbi:MAG TPA: glycosyltransferase [Lutibacter sp.]|nr:glycosyltransferase [Lutibacter sp.]
MRIGMILDKTYPPDPRVENEALSLIKAGHQVFLFCLTYKGENSQENYKGIEVKRYRSNKIAYKLSALAYELPFYSLFLKPKIKHFINSNAIEVLHIHDIRIAGSVYKINEQLKLPIILDLHDNYPEVMKAYPHLQKFPGKYIISPKLWIRKEQYFIEKANYVISVSDEFIESLKNRLINNKEKVVLVPNSVRSDFYTNTFINSEIVTKFEDNFVLLYIGDTGLRRGLQTAIAAIPIIKKTISNIKLVIVGKSTTDYVLKQQVQDLKIKDNVSFEGWKNEKLLASYIVTSSIGISPLIRSKHHDLAYANKLFQYMSLGLPVLVSNATAQKRLVEKSKTGLVHLEKDTADFTSKVILMYQKKAIYNKFKNNAIAFIKEEFNWEITSKDLIKMYKQLS